MRAGRGLVGAIAVTCAFGVGAGAAQAGPPAPLNVVPPAVTGLPVQGQTLGHFRGFWTLGGDIIYSQTWVRCDATGAACVGTGVDTPNYRLGHADVGRTLRVVVTAHGDNGNGVSKSATSQPTTPILPGIDTARSTTLSTPMSGAEQSETSPADPDGTGHATFVLYPDAAQICYTISFSRIANTVGWLGHIHKGARGQSQLPWVFEYTTPAATNPTSGCRPSDPLAIADIINNPTQYYAQLHNEEYPSGVIRGQLGD
jgi:CHRD domain